MDRILLSSISLYAYILPCIIGHVNLFFEEGEANGVARDLTFSIAPR